MRQAPITRTQVVLIFAYVGWAVARQVAHDLKTLWRLTDPAA